VLPVLRMTTMSWQVWLGCVSVIERRGVGGGGVLPVSRMMAVSWQVWLGSVYVEKRRECCWCLEVCRDFGNLAR